MEAEDGAVAAATVAATAAANRALAADKAAVNHALVDKAEEEGVPHHLLVLLQETADVHLPVHPQEMEDVRVKNFVAGRN